ncbi:MAG: hypothetical protein IJ928_00355 [Prevotella sp.]|nr:hypothetical protein [Prevotella sp.]
MEQIRTLGRADRFSAIMKKPSGYHRLFALWAIAALLSVPMMVRGQGRQVVVADKQTHEPIAHASIYTKINGKFQSATTDDLGRAVVRFAFSRLTFSHLNYETATVSSLPDTLFLQPKAYMTGEVVVEDREPQWIRALLKRFVKKHKRAYFSLPQDMEYSYQTQSIGERSFYRFLSSGLLRMKNNDDNHFWLSQKEGTIISVDTTKLTDVANMRRMLYEDFVSELDMDFIREHKFAVNDEYSGKRNVVELAFRWKDDARQDHGRIVIDSAECRILEVTRTMGLKYNKKHRVSGMLLAMSWALTGYQIVAWDTNYHVVYKDFWGNMLPAAIDYKFFFNEHESRPDASDREYYAATGGGFSNMEASMTLSASNGTNGEEEWKRLPKSWYIKMVSDEERQEKIALAHLPAVFKLYE